MNWEPKRQISEPQSLQFSGRDREASVLVMKALHLDGEYAL